MSAREQETMWMRSGEGLTVADLWRVLDILCARASAPHVRNDRAMLRAPWQPPTEGGDGGCGVRSVVH